MRRRVLACGAGGNGFRGGNRRVGQGERLEFLARSLCADCCGDGEVKQLNMLATVHIPSLIVGWFLRILSETANRRAWSNWYILVSKRIKLEKCLREEDANAKTHHPVVDHALER